MEICSAVHGHLKHLTISVSTINQMYMVLRQLKYRSSIKFEYTNTHRTASELHLAWFTGERGYYTYRLNNSSLCMWFDNYVNTS